MDLYRYVLMQHCWNENPDRRPSFSEIKTYLQGHLSGAHLEGHLTGDEGEKGTCCVAEGEVNDKTMIPMHEYVTLQHSVPAYSKSLPPPTSEI